MNEDKPDVPSDAIVSVNLGPEVKPDVRLGHFELADGNESYGYVRSAKDGTSARPGERLVTLHENDAEGRYRATESYRHGPAQVSTPAYRANWDAIFAKRDLN